MSGRGKVGYANTVMSYVTRRGRGKSRRGGSRVSAYTPSYDGDSRYDEGGSYHGDGDSRYGEEYYDDGGESYYEGYDGGDPSPDLGYAPPDFEIAEAHAEEQNPQHRTITKPFQLKPLDLKRYGVGVVLYFTYMRTLSFCFFVLAILSLPSVYLNLTGNNYPTSDDPTIGMIEQSSLGNLAPLYAWEMGGAVRSDEDGTQVTAPPLGNAPPSPSEWVNSTEIGEWQHGEVVTVSYFGFATGKDELLVGLSYLNLFLLAVFTAFAFVIGPIQEKIVKEVDENLTTIEDYSVVIRDMPPDVNDSQELWKFFDKRIGKVQDVQLAYNTSELLGLALEREKVKGEYDSALGRFQKAREDPDVKDKTLNKKKEIALEKKQEVHSIDAAIRAIQNDRMGDPQVSIMAYVTFQDEESFLKCLKEFRPGLFAWLFRPKRLRMREMYRLVVKQAPPPSDIKWQNLQFGFWERQFRQFNVTTLTAVVLGIAFVAIAGVTTLENETTTEYDGEACRLDCAYETDPLTLENVLLRDIYKECWEIDLANGGNASAAVASSASESESTRRLLQDVDGNVTESIYSTDPSDGTPGQQDAVNAYNERVGQCGPFDAFCYACYCLEHIDAVSIFRESSYCSPYVAGFTLQIIARGASQGIILVLNIVLNPLLMFLVKYERHHSNSGEQRSLMVKLFLAQFFNSSINLLVIEGSFPGLKKMIVGTLAQGVLFEGEIEDANPEWYTEVGTSLAIAIITSPLTARFGTLLRFISFRLKRWLAVSSAVTQDELNTAFEGYEFDLSTRYGEVLNVLFVTMVFSGGMPILIPFAAITFMMNYVIDKFDFARCSKVPPWYSNDLAEASAALVAYSAVGHLMFAVWANSYYRIEEDPLVSSILGGVLYSLCDAWQASAPKPLNDLFGTVSDMREVARRALQKNTAWYTMILFLLSFALICRTIVSVSRTVLAELFPGTFARGLRKAEDNPPFDLAVQGEQLVGPKTYSIKEDPKYEAAFRKIVWETEDNDVLKK